MGDKGLWDFIGRPLMICDSVDQSRGHRWDRLFRLS